MGATDQNEPVDIMQNQEDDHLSDSLEPSPSETPTNSQQTKRKRAKKAPCWSIFKEYLENGKLRARCIHCKATFAADSRKNGTKNLTKHFKECQSYPPNMGSGSQTQFIFNKTGDGSGQVKAWKFDNATARDAVLKMVIMDEMTFQSVEKPGLRNLISAICPQFTMPSRTTMHRDLWKLYTSERAKVKELFKNSCERVCLTTDTWTSSNMESYMCITAHYVDLDWILQKKVINFCKIGSHRGNDIGRAIEDCLSWWELDKKLLTVTVDNASANDVACQYLSIMTQDHGSINEGKYLHVRCMTHIVNLIVQDGIKHCGAHVDKLRALVKYIRGSPARVNVFKMLADKWKVGCSKSLALDVCTRWNSTYDMLTSALPYKTIFPRMEILQGGNVELLSDDDWKHIEIFASYLKEFYALTNRISGSLYVTSNFMVFHIAHVMKVLQNLAASEDITLQFMASEMMKKCGKYWGTFDNFNLIMVIPTILDPHYKLNGVVAPLGKIYPMENADEMTTKVKTMTLELFERYVACYSNSESQNVQSSSNSSRMGESSWIQEYSVVDSVTSGQENEFELYLRERHEVDESTSDSLLRWWRLNGPRYPILSRMARDVFVIPITTVPSESTFSTGGRHLTPYRSRLKHTMVQALICTQDWLQSSMKTQDDDIYLDDNDGDEADEDGGTFCT